MVELTALWLPILLSAVIVFIASSIIHMVLPWHKSDYPKMANEEKVMDALRPLAIPPGDYFVPRPSSREEMRSPEYTEKMKKGPVMMLTVWPNGPASMGRNLILWFVYLIVVATVTGVVGAIALPPGADHHAVLHITFLTAFMGYTAALWQMSIWYRRAWSITIKSTIDGLIYAILTAGMFGWLWPG